MRWDSKKRRYVDSQGRTVSDRQLRAWIEEYIDSEKEEIDGKFNEFLAGSITSAALFAWMQNRVKLMHGAAGVVAYGGDEQMTPERWLRVGDRIASEFGYLEAFAADVAASPRDRIAEIWAGAPARGQMYADAVYGTYENSVKAREAEAGVLTGRRVCEEDRESCDGCISAASTEYLPLDEILDIGAAECLSNCRCTIEFNYAGIEPIQIERTAYAEAVV